MYYGKCNVTFGLLSSIDCKSNALDTGKIVVCVFLDLKKAFDTVNHDILL